MEIKPKRGNDCETCKRRFKCLTTSSGDVCPIRFGNEIESCFPYYNNLYISFFNDMSGDYRLKSTEILKLVKKAKFRTVKKYNRVYLEVVDEEEEE